MSRLHGGVSLQIVEELTPEKENRVILSLLRTELRLLIINYKRKILIQNEGEQSKINLPIITSTFNFLK